MSNPNLNPQIPGGLSVSYFLYSYPPAGALGCGDAIFYIPVAPLGLCRQMLLKYRTNGELGYSVNS